MSKNKIADSIIIRVGGGIREVPREKAKAESLETVSREPVFEQAEDVHPFAADAGANSKTGSDNIIN